MEYYKLEYAYLPKEIGRKFPQSLRFKTRMGSIQEDWVLHKDGPIDNDKFIVPDIELSKSAKVTNLISSAGIISDFLIVDILLSSLLSESITDEKQEWSIDIYWKGEKLENYFLFRLANPSNKEWLDFSKMKFELMPFGSQESVGSVRVKNYNELREVLLTPLNGQRVVPVPDEVYVRPYAYTDDLIRTSYWFHGLTGYWVSERLKNRIEDANLTGMRFIPLQDVNERIRIET